MPFKDTVDEQVRALQLMDFDWQLRMSFWPRKCTLSDRYIPMFSYAYRGKRKTRIPNCNIVFVEWATSEDYLIAKIKGEVR